MMAARPAMSANKTLIEWTDATWNPVRGCSRVSEGCRHCYAERMAARFSRSGQPFAGFAHLVDGKPRWTGKIGLVQSALDLPLCWRKPRRIFVNSMSDLFHENLPDGAIDRIFAVMALTPRHTFQILTKRPARMRTYLTDGEVYRRIDWWNAETCSGDFYDAAAAAREQRFGIEHPWPLPNVWLGVSVEDQATADARLPLLLDTPAAGRFVSAEPLLGPVTIDDFLPAPFPALDRAVSGRRGPCLDWVIAGGESGPGARPMHPDWARSLRDQCAPARVAFFFKQWGAWWPAPDTDTWSTYDHWPASKKTLWSSGHTSLLYSKKATGRLLGDREWNQFPR